MTKQTCILLLLIINLSFVGCSRMDTFTPEMPESIKTKPSVSSTSSQAPSIATSEIIPNPSPRLSLTPTAYTIEDIPELEQGTYLTYTKPGIDEYELVFISLDARRWLTKSFLVNNPYSLGNTFGVSPDGKFYAYYSGSAGDWGSITEDMEYDLQLNIVSLEDDSIFKEIPLLSEGFPSNFHQPVEHVRELVGPEFMQSSDEEVALAQYHAFLAGIGAHRWSPNGRYLAFSGQIDGPSSDLYVFDVIENSIRRLSSGPEQIQRISWSPNSEYIMHASSHWIGVNPPVTHHAAKVDGSQVISFAFDQGEMEEGWINSHQYLAHEAANVIGDYDIKVFDVRDGSINVVWPKPFAFFRYHPNENQILVVIVEPTLDEAASGVYLVDPRTKEASLLDTGLYTSIEPLDRDDYLYAVSRLEEGTYLLTAEYKLEHISDYAGRIVASPDMRLLALFGVGDYAGLQIFSIESEDKEVVFKGEVTWLIWAPDQSGLFFISESSLYHYDRLADRIVKIDEATRDELPRWGGLEFVIVN